MTQGQAEVTRNLVSENLQAEIVKYEAYLVQLNNDMYALTRERDATNSILHVLKNLAGKGKADVKKDTD